MTNDARSAAAIGLPALSPSIAALASVDTTAGLRRRAKAVLRAPAAGPDARLLQLGAELERLAAQNSRLNTIIAKTEDGSERAQALDGRQVALLDRMHAVTGLILSASAQTLNGIVIAARAFDLEFGDVRCWDVDYPPDRQRIESGLASLLRGILFIAESDTSTAVARS